MTAYTGTAGMHDTGRSQPRLCLHERIQQLQGPKNHAFQPEVQVHLTRLDCAQVCELRFILPDWTVRRCVSCGSFYQIGLCAGSCENRNMEGGKIFMKLLIDDAHMDLIRHLYEFYPVDGVTTNPSILAKSKRNPYEVLKEIRAWIGADAQLHVQAVSREAAGMEEEAHRIVKELGENTYVKIPALPEGFKAMVPAILILTFAWTLKAMTDSLGAAPFVEAVMKSSARGLMNFLPAIIFLVGCGLAFASGTSWGTFGILIPIVVAVFEKSNPTLLIISISACMAGAVCGDHCSPISDTTIMASAGAQCDHVNHVSTQLPYAIVCAVISFITYIIAGFVQSAWVSLPIGIVLMLGTVVIIKKMEK